MQRKDGVYVKSRGAALIRGVAKNREFTVAGKTGGLYLLAYLFGSVLIYLYLTHINSFIIYI